MTFSAQRQAGAKMKHNARVPHARAGWRARVWVSISALLIICLICLAILIRNHFVFSEVDILTYLAVISGASIVLWFGYHHVYHVTGELGSTEVNAVDIHDVLEKRVCERAVELMTSEAARAAESERLVQFGNLAQGLFHDLMSPLSAISLYLERLPQTAETNGASELLGKVSVASVRMRSFMDSVKRCLGDSRAASPERAQLVKEVLIVRDLLAYKARLSSVDVRVGTLAPVSIAMHPMRLHQMIMNLVTNGIDACLVVEDARSCFVEVSSYVNGSQIIVAVSDNGCGIPEHIRQELFERPHTTKVGGTGIGLMTVKSIVENDMHGTITVETKRNRGTTFMISVPRTRIELVTLPSSGECSTN